MHEDEHYVGWERIFDYPRIMEIRSAHDADHPASTDDFPVQAAYVITVLERTFGGRSWTDYHVSLDFAGMPEEDEWIETTRDYYLWWWENEVSINV
jgi:hypothetical protein